MDTPEGQHRYRMLQRREPVDYLSSQKYLTPYPDELGLRNRV